MMSQQQPRQPWRFLEQIPLVNTLRASSATSLRADLVAALTTTAMLVPQAMAYASLAGQPPIVGLYASTVPLLFHTLAGRTPQLAVGPVAMASLLVAEGLAHVASAGSTAFVALGVQLTLMVGAILLLVGLLRLGFLAALISTPVMTGFTLAAAVLIAQSQLPHALGFAIPRAFPLQTVRYVATHLGEVHPMTFGLATGGVLMLLALRRWTPRAPGALLLLLFTTTLTWLLGLEAQGVAVVGQVPRGLPSLLDSHTLLELRLDLLPLAALVATMVLLEALAVVTHYGAQDGREPAPNVELIALGLANLASGFFRGLPVSGALSRSAVQASAGARTNLCGAASGLMMLLVVAYLTPLFSLLPQAALAAIVLAAVSGLVDMPKVVELWRSHRRDLAALALTFASVLLLGVEIGVLLGVGTSLAIFLLGTARPHVVVLGLLEDDPPLYHDIERHHHVSEIPDVLVVRIDAPLYFANAAYVAQQLRRIEEHRSEPLAAIVIDASGINQIDSAGEQGLRRLLEGYDKRNISCYLANLKGPVYDVLESSGFLDALGREHLALNLHDAVERSTGRRHAKLDWR